VSDLRGKVAIVTGVGRPGQVGEAVARALGAAGAAVVVADRNRAGVEDRARALAAEGLVVTPSAGDLATPEAARAAVAVAEQQHGGLDLLVNVAGGLTSYGEFLSTGPDALDRELLINVRTAYCMCQAAAPALRSRGGGVILNFASIAVVRPVPQMAAYSAAKSAVAGLTRALARELRDDRIRVNAVAPEALRTSANLADMGSAAKLVPIEDLLHVILFLVSDEAAAISGQIIPVTGRDV